MLQKSKELFETWNQNSILYNHWKSNEHLMEGLDGDTDLDVLLSIRDKDKGCNILKQLDLIKFQSQFGSRYPNVEDWIGLDTNTGRLIHLHLHYALVTGHKGLKEYELPWLDEALESRIQDTETGVYVMNPNLELVTLYTRLILKSTSAQVKAAKKGQYSIDKHFLREILFIKKRISWKEVEKVAQRYFGQNHVDFVDIAKKDSITSTDYLKLHEIVTKTMNAYSRYHGLSYIILKSCYPIIIRARIAFRRFFCRTIITRKVIQSKRGLSIAFVGQDGSGKSTVTEEIQKWLNWKIDAQRFYLGSGDHSNGMLKRFISKGAHLSHKNDMPNSKKEQKTTNKKRKKNLKSLISSFLVSWYMLSIARHAYKTLRIAEKYYDNGGFPLYDRFPQMKYEGIYDGPRINNYIKGNGLDFTNNKWLAKIEMRYFEKMQKWQPDLVFKLLLPPEESIRRKPFENIDNVTQKHIITKELHFDNATVCEIDATQDYQKELIQIKNQIWRMMLKNRE